MRNSDQATAQGGLGLIDAFCRRFGLWHRLHDEGNRALSRQTLWHGPWLLDGILDGAGDVSEHLPGLLQEHEHRWQGRANYFYADSGSSAGKFLNRIERAGLSAVVSSMTSGLINLGRKGGETMGCEHREGAFYQSRQPKKTAFYPLVERFYPKFEAVYEER